MTASEEFSILEVLGAAAGPVDELLTGFVRDRRAELASIDPALDPLVDEIARLINAGGKRLRPAFVHWGHRATGGTPDGSVVHAAAAVEMLHTFALIHDDIMDRSSVRRGQPTVFRALADRHRDADRRGDPEWFGVSAGVLVGDLVHVWADQLFESSGAPPDVLARARAVYTTLRVEVMAGQYLELDLAARPSATVSDAHRVALLKSGRYTVTRPLHLGAQLGAPTPEALEALTEFGDAIGVAFQLRDDLLGMFGDLSRTGKGLEDDLREGKRTVLVLRALDLADDAGRGVLAGLLGNQDLTDADCERARAVILDSGAVEDVEATIRTLHERAVAALSPVDAIAAGALGQLADLIVTRTY